MALDPCGGPDQIVKADRIIMPPDDGLAVDWPERTYVNPPYNNLKPWMAKFRDSIEVVMLAPVRTHRRWFRAAMARFSTEVVYLDPLKFQGHRNTFPGPLCLLYRGYRPYGMPINAAARSVGLTS